MERIRRSSCSFIFIFILFFLSLVHFCDRRGNDSDGWPGSGGQGKFFFPSFRAPIIKSLVEYPPQLSSHPLVFFRAHTHTNSGFLGCFPSGPNFSLPANQVTASTDSFPLVIPDKRGRGDPCVQHAIPPFELRTLLGRAKSIGRSPSPARAEIRQAARPALQNSKEPWVAVGRAPRVEIEPASCWLCRYGSQVPFG